MRRRLAQVVGATCGVALAYWALRPVRPVDLPTMTIAETPNNRDNLRARPPWDDVADAFALAALWNPPAPDPSDDSAAEARAQAEAARTPPPLALIAIIDDRDNGLVAALYDLDANQLMMVRHGDTAQRYRVEKLTLSSITLHDGRREVTLPLRPSGAST